MTFVCVNQITSKLLEIDHVNVKTINRADYFWNIFLSLTECHWYATQLFVLQNINFSIKLFGNFKFALYG